MMPDYRPHNPYQQLLADAVRHHGCQVLFPTGYRRGLPLLRALADRPSARLLHLHWTGPYLKGRSPLLFTLWLSKFLLDLLLVRLSGRTIVWTLHNLLPHEARHPRLEIFARRLLCRLASKVIVHGPDARDEALRRLACPPKKLALIPHGHYRDVYAPAVDPSLARRRLGLPPDQRLFLYFGMLRPYKGVELLLRAWRRLAPADAALLLVGQPNDPDYAARVAHLVADTPAARWLDAFVPDADLPLYFSAADVVVLPFERVQTSGSLLLAMTYAKPVVAPRLGEIPDALAQADDFLYQPSDEQSLLAALAAAASANPAALADLSHRTRSACDRFDWQSIGELTARVYALTFDPTTRSLT